MRAPRKTLDIDAYPCLGRRGVEFAHAADRAGPCFGCEMDPRAAVLRMERSWSWMPFARRHLRLGVSLLNGSAPSMDTSGNDDEGASHLSTGGFSRLVARLNDEVRQLKKNKKKDPEIEQFLSCQFQCPGSGTCTLSEESQQRPEKTPSSKTEVELSKCMGELQKQLSE